MLIFREIELDSILCGITTPHGYLNAWSKLIAFAEETASSDNVLREYIITKLLNDENVLTLKCENSDIIGESLYNSALYDITKIWNTYYEFDYLAMAKENNLPYMNNYIATEKNNYKFLNYHNSLMSLLKCSNSKELLDGIIAHIKKYGCGGFAKYIAFTWSDGLIGIEHPDTISFECLVGLEFQKDILISNTDAFVKGHTSNNVLLCGDSGTGKSSSVKALLNKYYLDGLRLIEFPRVHLKRLPDVFKLLANRRNKYIIFLDDLSFEEDDVEYKHLKAVIDGQIEKQPDNVLLYATSNRRNLIKETWADRASNEEIHARDSMQEKMSLAERFGIRLIFTSPSQVEYLNIVESILKESNVEMTEEIKRQAIIWEMRYNGRSGRTAKQFSNNILQNGN